MWWSNRSGCLVVAFVLFAFIGKGMSNEQAEAQTPSQDTQNQEESIGDNVIKMFMDKIEILGRLERPQAVYIVPGNDPQIDDIRIDRNFFNEIFRQVEKGGRRSFSAKRKKESERKDFIPW